MKNVKHKIYLCDICFPERPTTDDEKKLRNTSEVYKNIFNRRRELVTRKWNNLDINDYSGLVDYLPKTYGGDIKESSDILIYLYKNKGIISNVYEKSISVISSFIIDNNIESVEFCGDDVERLRINGIDILKDIMDIINKANKHLEIFVSKTKRTTNGYHLI